MSDLIEEQDLSTLIQSLEEYQASGVMDPWLLSDGTVIEPLNVLKELRDLRQRVAEVEKERGGLREYLALILDSTETSQMLAWTHGIVDSEEQIALGKQLRGRLGLPEDTKGQIEALRAHEVKDGD